MIRVNDKWELQWRPAMTVKDVLVECQFTHPLLVVSVNGTLVPPSAIASREVADGDDVRVIHVIAGG